MPCLLPTSYMSHQRAICAILSGLNDVQACDFYIYIYIYLYLFVYIEQLWTMHVFCAKWYRIEQNPSAIVTFGTAVGWRLIGDCNFPRNLYFDQHPYIYIYIYIHLQHAQILSLSWLQCLFVVCPHWKSLTFYMRMFDTKFLCFILHSLCLMVKSHEVPMLASVGKFY